MADKPARVRLEVQNGSFLAGIRQAGDAVETMGRKMGRAFAEPAKAGLGAFRDSLKQTTAQVMGLAQQVAGIAGGLSVGSAVQGVVKLESRFRDLAFQVEQSSGEVVKWTELQRISQAAANETGRTTEEMAAAMDAVQRKSGDLDLSADSLWLIGDAMSGTGKSAEELGNIVGTLSKKFGIKNIQDTRIALMQIFEATKGGKIRFEELSEDLDELGSIAKSAGMQGMEGFRRAMGLASAVAPEVNQSISEVLTGMDQLTEKMRQMPVVKGLAEAGKFQGKKFFDDFVNQPDAFARVKTLLAAAGGKGNIKQFMRVATEEEFTGREERASFMALAAPFVQAYEVARDAGKSAKEATATATAAFDANVAAFGKTTMQWTDIERRAADNNESVSARIRQAQETWQRAFTDSRTMSAMNQLAQSLPSVARGMARIVEFAMNHPLLSVAGFAGGKATVSGIGTFAGEALAKAAKSSMAGVGAMIAEEAAKNGAWSAAGKSFGVVAAGAIGFALGKWIAENIGDWFQKKQKKGVEDDIRSFNLQQEARGELRQGGGLSQKTRAALEQERNNIQQKIESEKAHQRSTGRGMSMGFGGFGVGAAPAPTAVADDDSKRRMADMVERLSALKAILSGEIKVKVTNQAPSGGNGLPPSAGGNVPGYQGG